MTELSKKVASPGIFYVNNAIRKEMHSSEPILVGGDFRWQPATFDNPESCLYELGEIPGSHPLVTALQDLQYYQIEINRDIL